MKHFKINSKTDVTFVRNLVSYNANLNIRLDNLKRIVWFLRNNTIKKDLIIENLILKPLDFVNEGLLTIKQALKIIDKFDLYTIDKNSLCKSIITDIIINEPEIYFEKSRLKRFYFKKYR